MPYYFGHLQIEQDIHCKNGIVDLTNLWSFSLHNYNIWWDINIFNKYHSVVVTNILMTCTSHIVELTNSVAL